MNKLGGIAGILIFVSSLIAYAAETELAQVVQSRLGYSKPYFMLWLAHSSFSFCLPLHLLLLKLTSSVPSRLYLRGLALATRNELTPDAPQPSIGAGFWDILPLKTSLVRMFLLTGLATFAAICWWVSVKYTTYVSNSTLIFTIINDYIASQISLLFGIGEFASTLHHSPDKLTARLSGHTYLLCTFSEKNFRSRN